MQSAAETQQALNAACQGYTGPSAACQDALTTLSTNSANCTPTQNNPHIFCTRQCLQYYDDIIENCNETVSQVASYIVYIPSD